MSEHRHEFERVVSGRAALVDLDDLGPTTRSVVVYERRCECGATPFDEE